MDELIKRATKAPKAAGEAGGPQVHRVAAISAEASEEFVSEELLRPIRAMCRSEDNQIREAARYLILNLQHKSSIVRIRTLNVIDSLFIRSGLFRELVCASVNAVASCGGLLGSSSVANSSSSVASAERLSVRVKELLELWDLQYGLQLPRLRAMVRYLRESLRVQMPGLLHRAQERARRAAVQLAARRKELAARRERAMLEAGAQLPVVDADIARMDDILDLIFPSLDVAALPTPPQQQQQQQQSRGLAGPAPPESRKRGLVISLGKRVAGPSAKRLLSADAISASASAYASRDVGEGEADDWGSRNSQEDEEEGEEEEEGESSGGNNECSRASGAVTGHGGELDLNDDDDDDDDDDAIVWEDDPVRSTTAIEVSTPAFAAARSGNSGTGSISRTEMQELLAAVPLSGVEIAKVATTASELLASSAGNADAIASARDQAMHLSRSCLPRVQAWLQTLQQAAAQADADTDAGTGAGTGAGTEGSRNRTLTGGARASPSPPSSSPSSSSASDSAGRSVQAGNSSLLTMSVARREAVSAMIRRLALLHARLYRVLTAAGSFFEVNFFVKGRPPPPPAPAPPAAAAADAAAAAGGSLGAAGTSRPRP